MPFRILESCPFMLRSIMKLFTPENHGQTRSKSERSMHLKAGLAHHSIQSLSVGKKE